MSSLVTDCIIVGQFLPSDRVAYIILSCHWDSSKSGRTFFIHFCQIIIYPYWIQQNSRNALWTSWKSHCCADNICVMVHWCPAPVTIYPAGSVKSLWTFTFCFLQVSNRFQSCTFWHSADGHMYLFLSAFHSLNPGWLGIHSQNSLLTSRIDQKSKEKKILISLISEKKSVNFYLITKRYANSNTIIICQSQSRHSANIMVRSYFSEIYQVSYKGL